VTASTSQRRPVSEWVVLALYLAMVLLGVAFHEPWRDEWRAWMISASASGPADLQQLLSGEGHPWLWYGWLRLFMGLGDASAALALAGLLAGLLGSLTFFFAVRLPLWIRTGVLFSQFWLHEYVVVSRSYGLAYALTLLAILAVVRGQRWLAAALLLGLAAHTHLLVALANLPLIALLALPAIVLMFRQMNDALPAVQPTGSHLRSSRAPAATILLVVAFVLFILLRSGTSQGYATLLPKFYEEVGFSPAQFGLMLGLFNLASAFGTLAGGYLGDHFNRRTILVVSSIASVPFAYAMLHLGGAGYLVSAVLAGLLLNMPHSLLMVMSQELAPNRRGLAGGLVLGFIFASGSFMAWLESIAAESFGLLAVLSAVAWLPAAAAFFALAFPSSQRASTPATPSPTTAGD